MSELASVGAAPRGRVAGRWALRPVTLPVPALVLVGVGLAGVAAAGELLGHEGAHAGSAAMAATIALTFTPLAVFVLRRVPGSRVGGLMLAIGGLAYVGVVAVSWSEFVVAAWVSQWSWLAPLTVIPVLLLVVPDGALPSPRWRPLLVVLVACAGLAVASLAVAALGAPRTLLTDENVALSDATWTALLVGIVALAMEGIGALGVLTALVLRWRLADPMGRGQLACLLPSVVLLVVGIVLDGSHVELAWLPAVVAFPVGLTLAVLRYQFDDLDLYIHRGVVWLVVTAVVVAAYVGVATLAGATIVAPGSGLQALVAAAAVAALLQPAQWVAQRAARRLLYGRRDEPYTVITDLGRHAADLRDPLAVLPQIARTVVEGLRVPYAAVRVVDEAGAAMTAAESGRWAGPPESFPMVAHGRVVGELQVAARRVGTRFSGAEARLLRDLAGQAALAAEAGASAIALQRARDRLVLAREEERRRLRRDLHDGVGAALAGTRMLTEVVRRSLPAAGPAPGLLATLAADLEACAAEVRELIDGLRPAALDDGLAVALAEVADRFRDQGPAVELGIEGELTDLPAAVEVAAYRVVVEALTNVVKHAGAGTARVLVRRDDRHLEVRVDDDGRGFTGPTRDDGVGLASLRERAEELGGRCEIRSGGQGTAVTVLLALTG